jgi:hypothetical protein
MNRILVIGGTGNIGREVVSQLGATGARFRAMTRNPDAAACHHRSRWCAAISRFPRPLIGAWKILIRFSWYGWRRRRLRRVRSNESRTRHGESCSSQLLSRRRTRCGRYRSNATDLP